MAGGASARPQRPSVLATLSDYRLSLSLPGYGLHFLGRGDTTLATLLLALRLLTFSLLDKCTNEATQNTLLLSIASRSRYISGLRRIK